jgi:two-component system OmpR family sensor kinase
MLETDMVKPFIESIREECLKLKNTVEEFTKYVTTESVIAMPMELNEFLRVRVGELEREGLPVRYTDSGERLNVVADAGYLQFALRALAVYAQQAGATKIDFRATGDKQCSLVVEDDRRAPLTEQEAADMFNPLPAKRTPGLGLKLPLVKKIVDLHDGTISIDTKDGEGVRICIQLPLSAN